MVRRGGFGHFGAGGHEGVVEELTVIARVSHHVDDAHAFFSPFVLFSFLSCVLVVVCKIGGEGGGFVSSLDCRNYFRFGAFFSC